MSFFKAGAEEGGKPSGTPLPKTKVELETNRAESAVEAVRKYNLRDRYVWKRLADENECHVPFAITFPAQSN